MTIDNLADGQVRRFTVFTAKNSVVERQWRTVLRKGGVSLTLLPVWRSGTDNCKHVRWQHVRWRRREAMAYGFAKWRVSADSTACMMVWDKCKDLR